ncbi:hypothetical protein UFOVP299_40 [uncultured Caudovirales phage]|uniref:Uncharacterized protein n=1 Tax=uncultured Caudovirales phage TaxID=2100421 RepID=A0A6J5LPV1_9CAUD|nr:hypothetical protein UFOVP299_40 [uncultured Caudovirales phage]
MKLTKKEKKELEYVLNTAVKVAVGIAILFFVLLILTTLI